MSHWKAALDAALNAEAEEQERLRRLTSESADRHARAITEAVDAAERLVEPGRGARTRAVRAVAEHRGVSVKSVWSALARTANAEENAA